MTPERRCREWGCGGLGVQDQDEVVLSMEHCPKANKPQILEKFSIPRLGRVRGRSPHGKGRVTCTEEGLARLRSEGLTEDIRKSAGSASPVTPGQALQQLPAHWEEPLLTEAGLSF